MIKVVGFWSLGIAGLLLLAAGMIWPAVTLWGSAPWAVAVLLLSSFAAGLLVGTVRGRMDQQRIVLRYLEFLRQSEQSSMADSWSTACAPSTPRLPDSPARVRLHQTSWLRRSPRPAVKGSELVLTEMRGTQAAAEEPVLSRSIASDEPPPTSEVRLGISAPAGARPGEGRPIYFFAAAAELAEEVQRKVRDLAPDANLHPDLARTRWRAGLMVSVRLAGEHIEVDRPSQEFEWNGAFQILPFGLRVARDAPPGPTLLVVDVLVDGVVVAPIAVAFQVLAPLEEDRTESRTTWVRPARSAFASYSSEDRARVLDRVAVLVEGAGMDVAIDCLSLRPGERFKPQLADEIRDRELFLLYWSEAASHSEWVEWEWRQALDQKDAEDFILRPLDPLQLTELPEELSDLHAQSPIMLVRYADEILRRRRGPRAAPGRPSQVDQPAADGP